MDIRFGELLANKTWRFLVPTLRGYGDVFLDKFNTQVFKLAYGINDKVVEGMPILLDKRPLFIMCDKGVLSKEFAGFLNWVRYQPYYITDYQADTNMKNSRMHMLVLSIPEEYNTAYDKFCMGLYSEMYTPSQLDRLFSDKETEQYKILARTAEYGSVFLGKLDEIFNVQMTGQERQEFLKTAEYEFPYSLDGKTEIFNY